MSRRVLIRTNKGRFRKERGGLSSRLEEGWGDSPLGLYYMPFK